MKKLLLATSLLLITQHVFGQGCVAVRHFGVCSAAMTHNLFEKGDIQAGVNYRYFKSFRHFRGTHEEADRVANGTEVINNSHNWEYSVSYWLSKKTNILLGIPTQINTRSSLYEHGRKQRHMSFSRGLGDVRVGIQQWLLQPGTKAWNLQVGSSIKLPTGNFNSSDIFYNVGVNGSPEVRPVDQSIQLGDGGFGVILETQYYVKVREKLSITAGAFYLVNPRETNNIRTFREKLNPILTNEAITSVPDQFSSRIAANYSLNDISTISVGGRYEGVPVNDVFGGSSGFRRPGNILSIEPQYSYMKNNLTLNLSVPVAVRRNRPQSYTDLENQKTTGTFRQGDAAFADYAINVGIQYTFKAKVKERPPLNIF
ncbi:hypothetical protein [Daejeonella sp.]|uniref:hypothetical protein n=1 Tax=Daejeonella sp. TaxID=2805397 RepID=UPI0030C33CD4